MIFHVMLLMRSDGVRASMELLDRDFLIMFFLFRRFIGTCNAFMKWFYLILSMSNFLNFPAFGNNKIMMFDFQLLFIYFN